AAHHPDELRLGPWPASSPVAGGFPTTDKVLNRGLISGVVENEPLTESKLAPSEAGAGLPPSITEGMRALSIRVNEVVGVAGFVGPGWRVAVLVRLCGGRHGGGGPLTRVRGRRVAVLEAGTGHGEQHARDDLPVPT